VLRFLLEFAQSFGRPPPLLRLLRNRQLRLELLQPLLVARLRISEHLLQQRTLLLQRGFLRLPCSLRLSLRLKYGTGAY
jgi:hypothetical protein